LKQLNKSKLRVGGETSTSKDPVARFWTRPLVIYVGVIFIFALLALAAYWPIFPGDPSRLPGGNYGDPVQSVWFLRWVPYAISHSHNPFFTSWINVPYGANLAQNTLMPLLGLIASPITLLAGPVASFNLLAWLAFPISAVSMFYVTRRLTSSNLASFAAGLLYGFSPYMIGQGQGHIMLTFVPLPPLMLLAAWELIVAQQKNPYAVGSLLAAEVVAQFFIDPEVLAATALVLLAGVIVIALFRSKLLTKKKIYFAAKGIAATTAISLVLLAYPIWFMSAGTQHFVGPNFARDNPYSSDLIGLITPTRNERFILPAQSYFVRHTARGDYAEIGDYIGPVLLIGLGISVFRWRRNRWLVLCAVLALCTWILSLGVHLTVNGLRTGLFLPFTAIAIIPFFQDILSGRLSLIEWLFVSLAVAISIIEWQLYYKSAAKKIMAVRKRMYGLGIGLVLAAIVISLWPRWPYPSSPVQIPNFFKSTNSLINNGEVVLAYPYPVYPADEAMLWQATSNMRFKLIGAYIQNRSQTGRESEFPVLLNPPALEEWLAYLELNDRTPFAKVTTVTQSAAAAFLSRYRVGAILVDPKTVNASDVERLFGAYLGKPQLSGGIMVWNNVPSRLPSHGFK
jgi:hypothetical protein